MLVGHSRLSSHELVVQEELLDPVRRREIDAVLTRVDAVLSEIVRRQRYRKVLNGSGKVSWSRETGRQVRLVSRPGTVLKLEVMLRFVGVNGDGVGQCLHHLRLASADVQEEVLDDSPRQSNSDPEIPQDGAAPGEGTDRSLASPAATT